MSGLGACCKVDLTQKIPALLHTAPPWAPTPPPSQPTSTPPLAPVAAQLLCQAFPPVATGDHARPHATASPPCISFYLYTFRQASAVTSTPATLSSHSRGTNGSSTAQPCPLTQLEALSAGLCGLGVLLPVDVSGLLWKMPSSVAQAGVQVRCGRNFCCVRGMCGAGEAGGCSSGGAFAVCGLCAMQVKGILQ